MAWLPDTWHYHALGARARSTHLTTDPLASADTRVRVCVGLLTRAQTCAPESADPCREE